MEEETVVIIESEYAECPQSIRISAYDVEIIEISNGEELGIYGDFRENMGEYAIRIPDRGVASDVAVSDTLIHEIIHAIMRIYNVKLPCEEDIALCLGTAMTQVFRDNPEVLNYIQYLLDEE